jgi:CDP-diacylglycerol---glycerol-3-phosphate 3-phosphatidyltransferase
VIKESFSRQVEDQILRRAAFVTRVPLSPDQLTLIGVAISLCAGLAYALGAVVTAGCLLIPAGVADLIDGVIARKRGLASPAGAFFDSTMDRLSDLVIFSGIAVGTATAGGGWETALVCWALSGTVLTSYTRARAEALLGEFSVGFMERAERILILIAFSLADRLDWALWIIALGSTVTSVQRVLTARRLLREASTGGGSHLRLVSDQDFETADV